MIRIMWRNLKAAWGGALTERKVAQLQIQRNVRFVSLEIDFVAKTNHLPYLADFQWARRYLSTIFRVEKRNRPFQSQSWTLIMTSL